MTGSAGSTTGYTQDLFGVDVSGGGLAAAVHPGELELGAGLIAGPYNEATKKLPVAVDAGSLVARWRTDYEVDFASLPDQTLGDADGTKTIDGRTWIVANSTNEYSYDMQIVNGSGLRSNPASGNTYSAGTSPIISLQGTEIWDADLDPTTPVRVSLLVGSFLITKGYIVVAHDCSSAGAGGVGSYLAIGWTGYVTPLRSLIAGWAGLQSSSLVISDETGYTDCDCARIVRPTGVTPLDARLLVGDSVAGAFPASTGWYPVNSLVGNVGYPTGSLRKERGTLRYHRYAIAFQMPDSTGDHYLEVKKLRIETFR